MNRRTLYVLDLGWELVRRELKIRYKRSVLGLLWALVVPLAQLLVFGFLFGQVVPMHVARFSSYVFCGLLVWSWFQSSLALAAGSITDNRELVRRPGFPSAVLPGVTVTTNLIHFLLASPILILFLLQDGMRPTLATFALPLLVALQFMLTLGLAYFVATLNVTFRDTGHIVGLLLMLLFYLTPIFYESSSVPASYQPVYHLNPLVYLIDSYRQLLLDGQLPGLAPSLATLAATVVLLWLGHRAFRRASGQFVEEL